MSHLSEKAIEIAISQLGVHEDAGNKNTGPQVNEYLGSVGLSPGNSWCMAFMYWCFNKAADQLGIRNPLAKTAGVIDHWNKKRFQYGKVQPEAGDIFIMDFGSGKGHTGIIEKVDPVFVYTIEGNSNDEGSREGYEVCRRKRTHSSIKGYLRF